MFETTNQITIIFPLLLIYTLLTTINITINHHSPNRASNAFASCSSCIGQGRWAQKCHVSTEAPEDTWAMAAEVPIFKQA